MKDSVFNYLFKRIGQHECVPSEGNKKKAEGCFNALNDYGKEPTEAACKRCWREYLKEDNNETELFVKYVREKYNHELKDIYKEFISK